MNWERHLLKSEGKLGEVRSLLAPSEFVLDGVFVTKRGHLGCVVKLSPVPAEGKDPGELEAVAAGFVASLYSLDPSMRVYQHALKDPAPDFQCSRRTPRLDYLESAASSFFSVDVFLSVIYEVEPIKSGKAAEIDRQMEIEAGYLATVISGMIGGWRGIRGELLAQAGAFSFLSWLVNYEPRLRGAFPSAQFDVDWQMAHSAVDANGALRIGSQYVRVLTLKDLPKNSSVFFLRDVLSIRCGMVLAVEWKPVQYTEAHRSVKTHRRHVNNSKTSITSGTRVVDGGMAERDRTLETAQQQMEKGQYLGRFALTVILYAGDPANLRKAVAAAHAVLQMRQGTLVEQHGKSALVGWLATIPGNKQYSIRQKRIFAVNYGDFSFLFGADAGNPVNEHFEDEALVVLENKYGQPYYFNFHKGGVGHTLFTGRSGTGKTYATNLFIDSVQKYPGVRTVIFDIMNGYELLTERLGGVYIQLGEGERGGATINPFALDPTEDNFAFLFSLVRLLIESDGAGRMPNRELLDLDTQIRNLYRLTPSLRRLRNLVLMPHVSERLDRWVTRESDDRDRVGIYAHLFDNEQDSISMGKLVAFNFPDMQKDHPEALEALTFYIIHLVNREVKSGGAAPKFVFMDEALAFLRNPEIKQFMAHALMRWRHHNAALFIATQSLSHLEGTVGDSILEQCVTRLFAANPGIDPKVWAERFRMSETEAELIPLLKPAGEILVQGSGVVTVKVDPVSHALYSNGPYHKEMRAQFIGTQGIEEGLKELAKT